MKHHNKVCTVHALNLLLIEEKADTHKGIQHIVGSASNPGVPVNAIFVFGSALGKDQKWILVGKKPKTKISTETLLRYMALQIRETSKPS